MGSQAPRPNPRVLVAGVTPAKSRSIEDLSKIAVHEIQAAKMQFVRNVTVRGEERFIQQLISNVSTDNEADAIVMVGNTGFGPHDVTMEAIDSFVEKRIEGFAEAYRRLLHDDGFGPRSMLMRATAGAYNQCLVFALTGRGSDVKRAMQTLILPTLGDALELATGRLRAHQLGRGPNA